MILRVHTYFCTVTKKGLSKNVFDHFFKKASTSAKKIRISQGTRKLTKKIHINFWEKAVSKKTARRQIFFHQVRLKKERLWETLGLHQG